MMPTHSFCVTTMYVLFMGLAVCSFQGGFADQLVHYSEADSDTILFANDQHYCFEHKCKCVNSTADCSRNHGRLEFVPKLPEGITFLDFSNNKVNEIGDDFFLNVTNITGIDLSYNGLAVICSEAFRPLTRLDTLKLNYNHKLTYETLAPVFSVPGLKTLELIHVNLGPFPSDLFEKFPMAHLEVLNLKGNSLGSIWDFALSVFSPLQNLWFLGLADNSVISVSPAALQSVQEIDLSSNYFLSFPPTCQENVSYFPSLEILDMSGVQGITIPGHFCLPALRILRVGMRQIATHTFTEDRFPRLVELDVTGALGLLSVGKYAFMISKLERIFLDLGLASTDIHDQAFEGCPNLSTVVLNGTFSFDTIDGKIQRLFGSQSNLKSLGLDNHQMIETITVKTFSPFRTLTTLSLSGCSFLFGIPDGAFDCLDNLTSLDLSSSSFSVLPKTLFNPTTRGRLRHLDVSGNPLHCSCDVMWIKKWLESDPSVFANSRANLTCEGLWPPGEPATLLSSFYMSEQACMLSSYTYSAIVAFSTLIIVFFTCGAAFFRCRRTFRPMLYDIFRGQGHAGCEHMRREDYQYDVFVSYASEDLDWVRAHLMPELEERLALKLCIHDRDFRPGKEIMANITDCLEVSRRVLMVFSTEFARSPWCQFELALCLRHVMDNADALTVVYLHEIPPQELTNNMVAVLRTCTYLQWSNDPEHRDMFWRRLREALYDVIRDARRQPA